MTLGGFPPLVQPAIAADAPKVLLFSPHPDDECIVGALPLRLLRESRLKIINVAVTQGSNKARQAGRLAELEQACHFLGFGLIRTQENGLEKNSLKGRADNAENWQSAVQIIAAILKKERPQIIFFPHETDWNSSHIGTNALVREALTSLGPQFSVMTVETEFWGPLNPPNLMIESAAADVADLMAAISFHVGEVRRNPYHLLLPAWMQDNVRRGAELVGVQGGAVPEYSFATLYRLRHWQGGGFKNVLEHGQMIGVNQLENFVRPLLNV